MRQSLEVRVDGERVFQTVQATWNLLEQSAGEALAEAHGAGYGVIVKESLANGRLAGGGDGATGPLLKLAANGGLNVDTVAIAAVLANPWVDVVLSGAITTDQLSSNLGALSVGLSTSDLEELAGLAEPSSTYWSKRQSMSWG